MLKVSGVTVRLNPTREVCALFGAWPAASAGKVATRMARLRSAINAGRMGLDHELCVFCNC